MAKVDENYGLSFEDDFNNELNDIAVKIGDEIKDLSPLERFYAVQLILDEIESRCMLYGIMGSLPPTETNSSE